MLSVSTLKYTFCIGWHSCWCLVLNDMIQAKWFKQKPEKLLVGQHLNVPFSTGLKRPRKCPVWPQINIILPSAALKFTLCQFLQHQKQNSASAQDIHPDVGTSPVRPHLSRAERTRVQLPVSYREDAISIIPSLWRHFSAPEILTAALSSLFLLAQPGQHPTEGKHPEQACQDCADMAFQSQVWC